MHKQAKWLARSLRADGFKLQSAQRNSKFGSYFHGANIPSDLESALGAAPIDVVNSLYGFGANPSNNILGDYSIGLLQASYSNLTSADMGFTVSDLMHSAYQLGNHQTTQKHGI